MMAATDTMIPFSQGVQQQLHFNPSPTPPPSSQLPPSSSFSSTKSQVSQEDPISLILKSSALTPYQKSVLLLLCQVPPGSFTTYGIMAAHLRSSPRAVGNVLRRNPFAPTVPCHRVVATGGLLGGFKGKIGPRDGEGCLTLREKRMLLREEGIKFDAKGGRVLGTPFAGFV